MSAYKAKSDLDFLFNLILDFLDPERQEQIISRLSLISKEENEITGWETWLQVEFYLYLMRRKDKVKDVVRESSYQLDKRSSYVNRTGKTSCRVDLEICRKNVKSSEKWIPLEIKQNKSASMCIKNMLSDWDKYDAIKVSEKKRGNFRYPFFFGIFKTIEDDKLSCLIKEYDYMPDTVKTHKILNTDYSFILI